MPVPCEIAVKSVIPAIRAYIAKELTQTYNMKQTKVAPILGITQTAVSKYVGNVRGQAIRIDHDKRIRSMMDDIALKIVNQEVEPPQVILGFCAVCKTVRESRLMCELCSRVDPTLDVRACTICTNGQACASNI